MVNKSTGACGLGLGDGGVFRTLAVRDPAEREREATDPVPRFTQIAFFPRRARQEAMPFGRVAQVL